MTSWNHTQKCAPGLQHHLRRWIRQGSPLLIPRFRGGFEIDMGRDQQGKLMQSLKIPSNCLPWKFMAYDVFTGIVERIPQNSQLSELLFHLHQGPPANSKGWLWHYLQQGSGYISGRLFARHPWGELDVSEMFHIYYITGWFRKKNSIIQQ